LQTLELANGTRRRKIDDSLDLQEINHDPILGHYEAYKSPRHHTKYEFMWVQIDIIIAISDENGPQVTWIVIMMFGTGNQII
jgi:hypothetical protein